MREGERGGGKGEKGKREEENGGEKDQGEAVWGVRESAKSGSVEGESGKGNAWEGGAEKAFPRSV